MFDENQIDHIVDEKDKNINRRLGRELAIWRYVFFSAMIIVIITSWLSHSYLRLFFILPFVLIALYALRETTKIYNEVFKD